MPKKYFFTKRKQNKANLRGKPIHDSMRFALIMAQCFLLLPVQGIMSKNPADLKFTWKSIRAVTSVVLSLGSIVILFYLCYDACVRGLDTLLFNPFIFHLIVLFGNILFLKLAMQWPSLMEKWTAVERSMRSYGYPKQLDAKLKTISAIILSLALTEHLLIRIHELYSAYRNKSESQDVLEYYQVNIVYDEIFRHVSYSSWKGIILQILNTQGTFVWSFTDLFIVLISIALTLRFKQITCRIKVFAEAKIANDIVWRCVREDYNRMAILTKTVNDAISSVLLLSFASNLLTIIVQLYKSLRYRKEEFLEETYFWFSFGFLILRTICVSLYAAWINEESKKPIRILFSLPSEIYTFEIRRLIQEIHCDIACLTGCNFFRLTRGIVLEMAAAIITYELVIFQFEGNSSGMERAISNSSA